MQSENDKLDYKSLKLAQNYLLKIKFGKVRLGIPRLPARFLLNVFDILCHKRCNREITFHFKSL
jgi:hypothetical protein